ncbi:carbon-nitrogen hydrolase family protein [Variovorax sp. JS1663]|uniref:carbon-nitrogen hydrolase family protein n=1 Tax=Variovorax sp. JS1663 TaxID=1851577 RepID=UPI000B342168|nr:carbon-nitrogen hydrolase family protein [Variovorax sp. JS1663]OUM01183.1 amidohydrolase [Variovorax sp. JS1663]
MSSKTHPRLRVAAVQAAPVFLDLDGTLDKTIDLMAQAAGQGVKLIAFPETWAPGYPWWIWLDSPAWGMQFVQRYHDNSLVVGSPEFDRIREAARKHGIWVSLGYSEKAAGSLYIAQALIDDQGRTVQTRRKLKPTHVERTVFGEGDGSDLAVCETAIGNVGSLSCWEHLQPLSKYAMYAQNEQIHCAAWPSFSLYRGAAYALGPEVNNAASQIYAAEGQCFVIAPCATVSPAMSELLCTDPGKQQMLRVGGGFARIYAPDGSPLGTPLPEDQEGLVVADIDLGMISLAKAAADPSGHYARPDVTRLLLDRTRRQPVVFRQPSEAEPASPETVVASPEPAATPARQPIAA